MTPLLKQRLTKFRPIIEAANEQGATYDMIAKQISMTRQTVSNYCRHLKINLRNRLTRNRRIDYSGWSVLVYSMRKRGLNQTQIAKELGVAQSTFTRWKQNNSR